MLREKRSPLILPASLGHYYYYYIPSVRVVGKRKTIWHVAWRCGPHITPTSLTLQRQVEFITAAW